MTLEEADKKIEFILQMQAQFEAGMGKLRDSQAALAVSVAEIAGVLRESVRLSDERFTRLDDRLIRLADSQQASDDRLIRLADSQRAADDRASRFDEQMALLAGSQRAADERLTRLETIMGDLAESQKATGDRLNALINVVDRHITGPDHRPSAQ